MWSSELTQGERCKIHPTVLFFGKVILGDDVTIHAYSIIGGQPLSADRILEPFPHYIPRVSGRPVVIEDKVIILNHSLIQTGVHIGRGSIIGNRVHIGHDSQIGECCRIHTGSQLAGHVTMKTRSVLNLGVTIAEGKTIAPGARIGNASNIVQDLTKRRVYFGNPARTQGEQRKRAKLLKLLLKEYEDVL